MPNKTKPKIDYSVEVRIPNLQHINSGLHYPTAQNMISLLGHPRKKYTDDCMPITNPELKKLMVYGYDVGPFNVSGLKKFAEALKRVFDEVRADKPDLYDQISTAGMLCCRRIRGSVSTPSNHSWGSSIDLKINGKLDQRGDGHCQKGLLELYPYMRKEQIWWGAEYREKFEDAMHWDWSLEALRAAYA